MKVMEHSKTCDGTLKPISKCWKLLELSCENCLYTSSISKDSEEHELPINEAMVVGAYCSGVGYTTIKNLLNCWEVSFVSKETYRKAETKIGFKIQKLAEDDMSQNLEAAKIHAVENEQLIQIGDDQHPFTSVIVDGGWAKRSYGHSYNSNSGVAVIVSQPLEKVLYMGFRIKTCKLCDENSEKIHHCFKNWEQSAQAMESDIIARGFQDCYDTHGLIFKYLIGDADSSVHSKVQSTVMYPGRIPVEKIDCANHGVRGLNSRIYSILNNTVYAKNDRDTIRAQQQRLGKKVWKKALREAQRDAKIAKRKKKKVYCKKPKSVDRSASNFYGDSAHQGTLNDDEIKLATTQLMDNLQVNSETRDRIQTSTIGQSFSEEWKFQRRDRLTASHCGRIFRLSDSTNNSSTLKSLLYPTDLSRNENIIRGINMEPRAKDVYAYQYGIDVEECGLFVSLENGVLAASPDGLIGTDGLLEVKSVNCMPADVLKRKSSFLTQDKVSKCLMLKRNHIYYYQVIQQLYVTGRTFCDFMVYHEPEDSTICHYNVERINRSSETDELWVKMKVKLLNFYQLDIAREIVDPTLPKGVPFKQPPYRESAINDKLKKRADKIKKKCKTIASK